MPFKPTIPTICLTCGTQFLAARPAATQLPRKFCCQPCFKQSRWTTPDKFWAQVQKSDGCWEYTGSRMSQVPYGELNVAGRKITAHRYSWELTCGPIPTGLSVCHRCDNPPCVRPDHLFLGTQADNIRDMWQKRRGRIVQQFGEQHHNAKFTAEQIHQIRARVAAGESRRALGREFRVHHGTIRSIVNRSTWSHLI